MFNWFKNISNIISKIEICLNDIRCRIIEWFNLNTNKTVIEEYRPNDKLQLFRGNDIKINDYITLHRPSLEEIYEYGECEYWSMVYLLTSTGADLKFQLWDMGIDYTTISDYELFYKIIMHLFKDNKTNIFFGDFHFSELYPLIDITTNEVALYDKNNTKIIDEYTYICIMNVIRGSHGLKRNEQTPANETTKQILIEDAREEYERNKNKEYQSQLLNMISSMVNCADFKYNHTEVWKLKICVFLDSVKRINKTKNAFLLLQSGYSGFGINLKDINKKEIEWQGELD